MNKSESKYFNTALLMNEALIQLLENKDLEYITVKEICGKAGVNRSTFYLHYETIDDLMNEVIENTDKCFFSYFQNNADDLVGQISKSDLKDLIFITSDFLQPYLTFIKEHKQIFRASFRNPKVMQVDIRFGNMKKYVIEPIMSRFSIPDEDRRYLISYYIQGIIAIINEWVMSDCQDSIDKIIKIIDYCVRPMYGFDNKISGE